MARATFNVRPNVAPTRTQIALAIAVIRSKPSDVSVRGESRSFHLRNQQADRLEYILQLREHVKQGANPNLAQDQGHYLDLVTYWQEQCKIAQSECDRLQGLNIKLERSNHMLATQTATSAGVNNAVAPKPTKRKTQTAASTRPSRRQPQSVADTEDMIEQDSGFLDALGEGR